MARAIDADRLLQVLETNFGHTGGADVMRQLIEAQPTLTPPNEWVSVDKKLPQCGVPVLIGNPHWDYPVVASYAGSGVWMDSWHQKMTFTPTHWTPPPALPGRRPPEGEEDA